MNTSSVDEVLLVARRLVRGMCFSETDWKHEVVEDLERLRDHYRKLAEREKALTEALEEVIAEVGDSSVFAADDWDFFNKALDALALHKEDA